MEELLDYFALRSSPSHLKIEHFFHSYLPPWCQMLSDWLSFVVIQSQDNLSFEAQKLTIAVSDICTVNFSLLFTFGAESLGQCHKVRSVHKEVFVL